MKESLQLVPHSSMLSKLNFYNIYTDIDNTGNTHDCLAINGKEVNGEKCTLIHSRPFP